MRMNFCNIFVSDRSSRDCCRKCMSHTHKISHVMFGMLQERICYTMLDEVYCAVSRVPHELISLWSLLTVLFVIMGDGFILLLCIACALSVIFVHVLKNDLYTFKFMKFLLISLIESQKVDTWEFHFSQTHKLQELHVANVTNLYQVFHHLAVGNDLIARIVKFVPIDNWNCTQIALKCKSQVYFI